jgi:hypothetical protein
MFVVGPNSNCLIVKIAGPLKSGNLKLEDRFWYNQIQKTHKKLEQVKGTPLSCVQISDQSFNTFVTDLFIVLCIMTYLKALLGLRIKPNIGSEYISLFIFPFLSASVDLYKIFKSKVKGRCFFKRNKDHT